MKIGLFALSGIRACDPELLELGLTLPGFVERSKSIASLPSLGLLTLAGMTPPEHEVRYIECPSVDALPEPHESFDLVAISSFTAQIEEAYRLAADYRDRGTPVVMGGLHVTALPDEVVARGLTAVVGEGESVWLQVLEDASRGALQPIYRGGEFDLADSPMPAFELLDFDRYNRITVQTSRGCPWKCSFCASSILLTSRYKQKPIERVLAEVDRIRELWDRPFIEFADDNSFVNRRYWHELLPQLAERDVRWFTETDISVAQDPELLDLAREAGCAEVLIGLESPDLAGLAGIETKRDWKVAQQPSYREAVTRIQSHGIRVNACFVVGLDGHTPEIFDRVLEFVDDVQPFDVQVTYPTPFPGTPFYDELSRQGRLTHPGEWSRCTLFDINFEPLGMTADELRSGLHGLMRELYSDAATTRRKRHFRNQLRGASSSA